MASHLTGNKPSPEAMLTIWTTICQMSYMVLQDQNEISYKNSIIYINITSKILTISNIVTKLNIYHLFVSFYVFHFSYSVLQYHVDEMPCYQYQPQRH